MQLPVTVMTTRRARRGQHAALESWAHSLCASARTFPGFMASTVEPVGAEPHRVLIGVTFATSRDLERWEGSHLRSKHLAEGDPISAGPPLPVAADVIPSREVGVPSPRAAAQSRSTLALLVWAGLFPLALVVNVFVAPLLDSWNVVLSTLVTSLAMVVFVVYVSLPLLQRLVAWRRVT